MFLQSTLELRLNTWYSRFLVKTIRMIPRIRIVALDRNAIQICLRGEVTLCRDATSPLENTKDPTPKSIYNQHSKAGRGTRDVPKVSAFANRRGKTLKSTARIARQVITIIPPRYAVTKAL